MLNHWPLSFSLGLLVFLLKPCELVLETEFLELDPLGLSANVDLQIAYLLLELFDLNLVLFNDSLFLLQTILIL